MSLQIQLKKSAVSQKQPFASDLAVGELALNYNANGPFLTCKDTAGNVRKINNVWVAASPPNNPGPGDLWLDTSASTPVLKAYKDSITGWVSASNVPIATTTIFGLVRLASEADITNGTSGKVVDAAQLQSKVSAELSANPITFQGVNVVNNVTIGGDLTVNGTQTTLNTTTLDVEDKNIVLGNVTTPSNTTADGGGISLLGATTKTLNWVNSTGAWTSSEHFDIASGKTYRINGTEVLSATALGAAVQISSANIPNGTIVDSDINASAEIAVSKLADGAARQLLQTDAAGTGVEWTSNVDIPGTLDVTGAATFDLSLTVGGSPVVTTGDTGTVTSTMIVDGTIVNGDINASAAIAGTKISPDFGSQNVVTTGTNTAASLIPTSSTAPTNGVYLPAANTVGVATNGAERLRIDSTGALGIAGANYGTSGQVLTSSGSGAAPVWQTPGVPTMHTMEQGNSSAQIIDTGTDGRFVVTTEGTERLRVTPTGSVGVGDTAPDALLTVNGVVSFGAGTASAPSIAARGDLNTGAFFPAADTFGIATGGSERARVDSSGRFGIGTTSPTTTLDVAGSYGGNITAVAALDINCAAGNYFTKTINGNSTFTVSNVPATRAYSFTLELTQTSGAVTWFSGVEWPGGTAPTLTTGKTHLFMFVTDDGGTRWRASSLINYTT